MRNENLGRGSYKLQPLVMRSLNVDAWKDSTEAEGPDATAWDPRERAARCRIDAWSSALLADRDYKAVAEEIPLALIPFTHEIAMTLHRMYLAGAVVDMPVFNKIASDLKLRVDRSKDALVKAAFREGMKSFSPTKQGDIRSLLYDHLGLDPIRQTKGGLESVDKYTLRQYDHKVVKLMLEFNNANKLYSTWHGSEARTAKRRSLADVVIPFTGVPADRAGQFGYLPFHINPLGARTSRRSSGASEDVENEGSESPNSQNWPKPLRKIIVSRFGPGGAIGNFDYSKLEVVLFAWLSGDEKLFDYFTKRGGYIGIAKDMFDKVVEKDTTEYTLTKSTVLAVQYYAMPFTLANQLWYKLNIRLGKTWEQHMARVTEFREQYLKMFPEIPNFFRRQEDELLRTHQVRVLTGRVRHLPHSFVNPPRPRTPEYGIWKHLVNEAINAPVQGLAAEVTGSAEVDIERELCAANDVSLGEYHAGLLAEHEAVLRGERFDPFPMTRLINEVHDSIVADIHPAHAKRDRELIIDTMKAVPTLRKLCPAFDLKLGLEDKVEKAWGG